jgi:signal transduction histidine kinase
MIRTVDEQLLVVLARNKAVVEQLRTQVRRQEALAVLSQRALTGIEPLELMEQAVALVARALGAADSEIRDRLLGGRGFEIHGDDHTAQTSGISGTQHRTFTRTEANFLRVVASLLDMVIQRSHREARLRGERQKMQDLARHLQEIQEGERQRLAQAIHDDLGQALIGLQLDVAWLAQRLKGVPVAWRRRLKSMTQLLDALLEAAHHIGTSCARGF